MPGYWILKTEPDSYSFDDLVREGTGRWDGVKNPVALRHIGAMRPGDGVLIYHTGQQKAAVGQGTVAGEPYPDPAAGQARLLAVDLKAGSPLPTPVPLAAIKADPLFADHPLVRIGRLSVAPLSPAQWNRLLALGGR